MPSCFNGRHEVCSFCLPRFLAASRADHVYTCAVLQDLLRQLGPACSISVAQFRSRAFVQQRLKARCFLCALSVWLLSSHCIVFVSACCLSVCFWSNVCFFAQQMRCYLRLPVLPRKAPEGGGAMFQVSTHIYTCEQICTCHTNVISSCLTGVNAQVAAAVPSTSHYGLMWRLSLDFVF